jgi:hypothetical protein
MTLLTPQQIEKTLKTLPDPAREELANFLGCLQHKYQAKGRHVVQLGGLWADIPFDVEQADIRILCQQATAQRLEDYELPG